MIKIEKVNIHNVNANVDTVIGLAKEYAEYFPIELAVVWDTDHKDEFRKNIAITERLIENKRDFYTVAMRMIGGFCFGAINRQSQRHYQNIIWNIFRNVSGNLDIDNIILDLPTKMNKKEYNPNAVFEIQAKTSTKVTIPYTNKTKGMLNKVIYTSYGDANKFKNIEILHKPEIITPAPWWDINANIIKDQKKTPTESRNCEFGADIENEKLKDFLDYLSMNLSDNYKTQLGLGNNVMTLGNILERFSHKKPEFIGITDPDKIKQAFEIIRQWQK